MATKKGNPRNLSRTQQIKSRPFEKSMAWFYGWRMSDAAPTKLELRLRGKSEKIVKNPFQKTGFLGIQKRVKSKR